VTALFTALGTVRTAALTDHDVVIGRTTLGATFCTACLAVDVALLDPVSVTLASVARFTRQRGARQGNGREGSRASAAPDRATAARVMVTAMFFKVFMMLSPFGLLWGAFLHPRWQYRSATMNGT
jgi:hypothetical protein